MSQCTQGEDAEYFTLEVTYPLAFFENKRVKEIRKLCEEKEMLCGFG